LGEQGAARGEDWRSRGPNDIRVFTWAKLTLGLMG
jgi:hypothetical protein